MTDIRLSTATNGDDWVRIEGEPLGFGGPVYCRLAEVEGRLRIVGLHIDGQGTPIRASSLRTLPLSVMEAYATGALPEHAKANSARRSDPGDIMKVYFQTPTQDLWEKWIAPSEPGTAGDANSLLANYRAGQPLTDEFFRDVYRAYLHALRTNTSPAKHIAAEAGGVEQKTAESWIYKARKKGVMPPPPRKGRLT